MNDTCTACGKHTEAINSVTIERSRVVDAKSALYGKRVRKNTELGAMGKVHTTPGLCDSCVAQVREFVSTMVNKTRQRSIQ